MTKRVLGQTINLIFILKQLLNSPVNRFLQGNVGEDSTSKLAIFKVVSKCLRSSQNENKFLIVYWLYVTTPCLSAPVRCATVSSQLYNLAKIASPVLNYASSALKIWKNWFRNSIPNKIWKFPSQWNLKKNSASTEIEYFQHSHKSLYKFRNLAHEIPYCHG